MGRPTLLRRGSSVSKLRELFVWKGTFPKPDTVELVRLAFLLLFQSCLFSIRAWYHNRSFLRLSVPGDQWLLCSAIQSAGVSLRGGSPNPRNIRSRGSEDPSLSFPFLKKDRFGGLLGHRILQRLLFCFILSCEFVSHDYTHVLSISSLVYASCTSFTLTWRG